MTAYFAASALHNSFAKVSSIHLSKSQTYAEVRTSVFSICSGARCILLFRNITSSKNFVVCYLNVIVSFTIGQQEKSEIVKL